MIWTPTPSDWPKFIAASVVRDRELSLKSTSYEEQFGPVQRRLERLFRAVRWCWKGLRGEDRTILVELNWRLGDEVMALPVFEAIHRHHPRANVFLLSNNPVLFRDNPFVHVSESPPDVVDRYLLLRGASRFEHRLSVYCRKAGVPVPDLRPHMRLADTSMPPHLRIPSGQGPLIALAPGASWPTKRWERSHWKALGDQLTAQGCRLVVLGQAGEGLPCGWDLTGQTTVEEAARVLHAADLAVCCDSGLMHVARAVDTPVVALFGPTDPNILIRNDPDFTALRSTDACSGFWNHAQAVGKPGKCPEGHTSCLESIPVESVIEAVFARLGLSNAP